MKRLLTVTVVFLFAMPVSALAADTPAKADDSVRTALALAGPPAALASLPKESGAQLKQSAPAAKITSSPKLAMDSQWLNAGQSSLERAALYSSPGDLVRINPFFSSGFKGLEAQLRW